MKLHKWLRKTFSETPLSALHRFLRTKKVKLNGVRAKGEEVLHEGDEVRIFFLPTTQKKENFRAFVSRAFRKKHLPILYEDDDVFAINKAFSIAVQPGSKVARGRSIIELAEQHFPSITPHLVHRIDKETSGVLLLAKHGKALRSLLRSMQNGSFEKQYLALVFGCPQKKKGIIRLRLQRKENGQSVCATGKRAVTHYEVVEEYSDISLVRLRIETGRTHQIRVHMASIGHPLVGDNRYGDFQKNKRFFKECHEKGLFLHAQKLVFPHPETKREICVHAPLPERWEEVLRIIRRNDNGKY